MIPGIARTFVNKNARSALLAVPILLLAPVVHASEARQQWQNEHAKLQDAFQRGDQIAVCQQVTLANGFLAIWYSELSAISHGLDSQADGYRRVAVAESVSSRFPTSTNALLNAQIERAASGISGKVSLQDAVRIGVEAKRARIELEDAHQKLQSFYDKTWNSYCR